MVATTIPVRLENGVLIIEGDQSTGNPDDRIRVRSIGGSTLQVKVKSGDSPVETYTFVADDVNRIQIDAGDGDDHINVGRSITLPVYVDGGAGDDTIKTGAGDDNIVDLLGNNVIESRGGSDVVNTGDGHDRVDSGSGDDLVRTRGGCDVIYAGGRARRRGCRRRK